MRGKKGITVARAASNKRVGELEKPRVLPMLQRNLGRIKVSVN